MSTHSELSLLRLGAELRVVVLPLDGHGVGDLADLPLFWVQHRLTFLGRAAELVGDALLVGIYKGIEMISWIRVG
jgi:hypothetical protein